MRKILFSILAAFILILTACGNSHSEKITPTGYDSSEIGQPQIMLNGIIYYYYATGFNEVLPIGYAEAGSVENVDNYNEPTEDYCGARVEIGQKIYSSDIYAEAIYIKYSDGYAKFSVKESE